MEKVIVVGAGPAGLVAALEFVQHGYDVIVVEKAPHIGGLHRSFHYGPFTFDVGVHCFDTTDREATEYILSILDEDYRLLPPRAAYYLRGRYLRDPLNNLTELLKLPAPLLIRGLVDFALRPRRWRGASLEEFGRSMYGTAFSRHLVKAPVEKVVQWSCADLHPDAAHLLNVNIPDHRLTGSELVGKVVKKLRGSWHRGNGKSTEAFQLYPASGGFEVFVHKLAQRVRQRGGVILTGARISAIRCRQGRVVSVTIDGREHPTDWLVWSGNLNGLMRLWGLEIDSIPVSAMILYNLEVKGDPLTDYLWIECWEPSLLMSRVSYPSSFRRENAPPNYHGLSVEVPCRIGDRRWVAPETFIDRVKQDLTIMGLLTDGTEVAACHIERIPAAFPILPRDYKPRVDRAKKIVHRRARNLVLIGAAAGRVGKMQNDQITFARRMAQRIIMTQTAVPTV
ncbi:MAG: FAD-dependent oxidoreductase [Acidobacteria bacterium]|nr:MAG: FAD-dependent oxidoreductase [Acidobacteriota bacterium]